MKWSYVMKRILKGFVPLLMAIGILLSICWYLFVYDRAFTRDILISQARYFDSRGNADFAALLYDLAYDYTGKDEDVAIELANQYKADGNYTKAEYTLTHAISDRPTADLYIALCKTFVEQDKLLDAVAMLESISDPAIRQEIDALRPAAPVTVPDPGYYNQYITVEIPSTDATLHCTTNGEYPSVQDSSLTEPITLPGGETVIHALHVAPNGLVSPLTVVSYTVGGVIEEAKFTDPAMELALRELLGIEDGDTLMTDRLWEVTEFTVPEDAQTLTDLALLPYLEKLTVQDHKLDSLTALSTLTLLKELDLSGCRFPSTELKTVAGLPALEKLSLSRCSLSTIADLAGAMNLKVLDLSNNTLRNLEPLIPMTTLEEVNLQHNAVTSLDALMALTNLKKLDLSYNSINSILPLAQCSKLEWLNVGNNLLTNLEGIDTFPALIHLDADHNQLTEVKILSKCVSLQELNLSNNSLTYIHELCSLVNLVTLNCSYNELYHLPIWPRDCALSTLDCSYNNLSSLDPLTNLQELRYVYMDYNDLTSLNALANCYHLVMVNAYGNEIYDVSELTKHNIIVNYDPT